ncbi:MFS transporter [Diplocloster agilis]|nr:MULTISPECIES: MFS transporter [Lachnospiraceae]MCU6733321.1 MFS transporter [Suonthocola fibrivorans]SCI87107.1 L-galactonate transporter [uncultured Clostridium sp.]
MMEKGRQKIWNPLFTTIFIANACMNLSQQMMNSLVSKYADYLGAAATVVGIVASIYSVTALIFKIISGPVIDTYNRRFILSGTMLIMAVSFFGYGIAGNVPALIGLRLLQGVGQAFTSTCCLALAADTLPKEKFGSGIGVFSMAQAASQAIGPTIALGLIGVCGYQATFMIGSGIMVFAAFLATRVKVPYQKAKKLKISVKSIVAKEAIMPAFIIFLMSLTYFVVNSFLIVYAGKIGVANIGYYFTVFAGTMLITRPMIGKLTDRYGLVKIVVPSLICFAASFLIISYSRSLPMFLLAAFVAAFGYGASQPAIQALSLKCVPKERRGAGSSTNFIGTDLGSLLGPILAGAVADLLGYEVMWRVMILPVVFALVIVLFSRKRISRMEENFKLMQQEE